MYDYDYYYPTTTGSGAAAAGLGAGLILVILLITLIPSIVLIISLWKIFKKAGKNGWEAIVPVYNIVTLLKVVGINPLFILVSLIPFVGGIADLVLTIVAYIRLSQGFGKTGGFVAGLILLPIIFMPMLAFGKNTWDESKIDRNMMSFLNDKSAPAAASTDSTEPTAAPEEAPAEPVATANEPVAPAEPIAPAESTMPAEPAAPVVPEAPAVPSEPVAPEAPAAPSEPVAPTEPVAPAAPEVPEAPKTPETPDDPSAPTAL